MQPPPWAEKKCSRGSPCPLHPHRVFRTEHSQGNLSSQQRRCCNVLSGTCWDLALSNLPESVLWPARETAHVWVCWGRCLALSHVPATRRPRASTMASLHPAAGSRGNVPWAAGAGMLEGLHPQQETAWGTAWIHGGKPPPLVMSLQGPLLTRTCQLMRENS